MLLRDLYNQMSDELASNQAGRLSDTFKAPLETIEHTL